MAATLSIIIPAFNEEATLASILDSVLAVELIGGAGKEIILVNDCSTDRTGEVVEQYIREHPGAGIRYFSHEVNRGKGAALHTGIREARGEYLIIQDADLEYDPRDFPLLIGPIVEKGADAVYGSRFTGSHRVFLYWHFMANKSLTWLTNVLYDTMLTDMETGYKAVRTELLRAMNLKSNTFDIEPEITAKLFKRKHKVFEVPISYNGRSYAEGKKIKLRDAFIALWAIFRFRFGD